MLWVLLPAFNEEKSLPSFLPKIDQFAKAQKLDYRIIVVNDGSRDKRPKF